MCQYCGCREIGPIGTLMDEHVEIQNLCGDTRRHVERGDLASAVRTVRALDRLLRVHNAVEESSLYPAMTHFEEYADQAGVLYDEHDDVDIVIADALSRADDPASVDWKVVLDSFEVLYEHIIREDNGLFPAAAIALDTDDWERAERARDSAEASITER